ncbi:MAG: hypothetical protein H7844_14810 [Nitrospirae bacterium YQR-1]
MTQENKDNFNDDELLPYYRIANFLVAFKAQKPVTAENIYNEASKLIPGHLSTTTNDTDFIVNATKDEQENKKTYNSLCYVFIKTILSVDNWKITYAGLEYFLEDNVFGISTVQLSKPFPSDISNRAALTAEKNNCKIHFFFNHCTKERKELELVVKNNSNNFKEICVLVFENQDDMTEQRQKNYDYPVFFTCFEKLREKCAEINEEQYLKLCSPYNEIYHNAPTGIASVKAEILDNIPVGENTGEANHYKLKFRAPQLPQIIPGQFIMINTSSATKQYKPVTTQLNLNPEAYLKRPFGIHRAYYPGFNHDYLRHISLPPALSTALYTVFPKEFDIFYKVLKYGTGTAEMKRLSSGDVIEILGPLGKRFELRALRGKGIEEVHVIGGGAGMAPMIFMVQALRFFAFRIKAFIGIESFDMLNHRDDSFTENPQNVNLYVDDLKAAGVSDADIFVSCDLQSDLKGVIPEENYHKGFVSAQYAEYLTKKQDLKKIMAFTCGPTAMMHHVAKITKEHGIELRVLMERRMGCGIGVCFSCVCETTDGNNPFSRVCVDGPIYEAGEILWETRS